VCSSDKSTSACGPEKGLDNFVDNEKAVRSDLRLLKQRQQNFGFALRQSKSVRREFCKAICRFLLCDLLAHDQFRVVHRNVQDLEIYEGVH
jgi:hypothetical protein